MSIATQPPAAPINGQATLVSPSQSLLGRLGERFGVDADKMLSTLKQTAFRQRPDKEGKSKEVTNEQLMSLLIVADQYHLNPWTKEIYAFPQDGGIVPIVGVDGWIRMMNEHPQFDGVKFEYGPELKSKDEQDRLKFVYHEWVECIIHRKDRSHPYVVREYFTECFRNTGPWTTSPKRMLRHKALIQANRLAFGFAGIYDEDEGGHVVEVSRAAAAAPTPPPTGRVNHRLTSAPATTTAKAEPEPEDENKALEREELIAWIESELNAPDISQNVLKEIGEKLRNNQQLLPPDVLADLQRKFQAKSGQQDQAFAPSTNGNGKKQRLF